MSLSIVARSIAVGGKSADVFSIVGTDGRPGLVLDAEQSFSVALTNALKERSIVHWHGQVPPPDQDGVSETGLVELFAPGETRPYNFVPRPGTHWMHSHAGLQEQRLMGAPLIVRTAEDKAADLQEVVVLLQDFSFRAPEELLAEATGSTMMHDMTMDMGGGGMSMSDGSSMNMSTGSDPKGGMGGMTMSADLNDIHFDAFLANERTLDDPLVVTTEPNGRVRLRIINAAAASAFWIDLGAATSATLIAVDGNDVLPIVGARFPLAEAQRIDLLLTVPAGGPVPVLAQLEGSTEQTGVILAPRGSTISRVSRQAERSAEAVDPNFESKLAARHPLSDRPADRNLTVRLTGSMSPYAWGFDGGLFPKVSPLQVADGERVAVRLTNETMMAHPIHLHGHHFQVVGINGAGFRGAVRDTVLVPAMGSVDLAFDANNRGRWLLHCHNLYHMVTGMMTVVEYV